MQALLGTEFAALLARAGVSQAAFARVTGTTACQVDNWCRRAPCRPGPPPWRSSCRTLARGHPDPAREVRFSWHETLGVPPNADADTVRRAMARLSLAYHPDKGGTQAQMARINAAYAQAQTEPGS